VYDVCKQIFIKVTYVRVLLGARCIYIYQLWIKKLENNAIVNGGGDLPSFEVYFN